ncbi:MAG: DUF2892 domain-containing protein [Nitrospirae bacterium]|nr:DUF2892 domain-containing protein [Nitrospirota bacterium]
MKKNMGTIDRVIRTVIAVMIAALYFSAQISGTVAIVLGVIAVVFLLTSLVGFCPIYKALGLSTRKESKS